MRFPSIVTLLSFPICVSCVCNWGAWNEDPTEIFSDLSVPRTLTEIEIFTWENCTQAVTMLATLFAGGTQFTANTVEFTFYNITATPTPIFVTYDFPQVTLTSFTPGEVLTWSETLIATDIELENGVEYLITVPPNAFTASTGNPTTLTVTATSTATISSTASTTTTPSTSEGVAPAVVGGIAAGIVGGFLLLGALLFFVLFKKPKTNHVPPIGDEETSWESKGRFGGSINNVRTNA